MGIIMEGDLSVAGLRDGYTVHGSRCMTVVKLAFPKLQNITKIEGKKGTVPWGTRGVVVMARTGKLEL